MGVQKGLRPWLPIHAYLRHIEWFDDHVRIEIYTNTLSLLPEATGMFQRAMGVDVRIMRVLLTVSDATAGERLAGRELGSELEQGLKASAYKARLLEEQAPADTVRVVTDGRPVVDIAREVVAATGWVR
jgi:hypothetical protein